MNSTYTTITIGPIYDTMSKSQKTRELWASSYFFSYLMREITKGLKSKEFKVLIPGQNEIKNPNFLGAGMYHDRIIISSKDSEEGIVKTVKRVMNDVLEETAKKIHSDFERLKNKKIGKEENNIGNYDFSKEEILNYLKNYIKLYGNTLQLESGNIIKELSALSDISDHQPKVMPNNSNEKASKSPLSLLFNIANWSFLFEDAFQRRYDVSDKTHKWNKAYYDLDEENKIKKLVSQKPKRGFDSLIEIATRELQNIKGKSGTAKYNKLLDDHFEKLDKGTLNDEENDLIESFKTEFNYKDSNNKQVKNFFDYHKYIAIVHSDGDNVGKIVNAIGENQDTIVEFSNALIQYSKNCTEIIYKNGGAPIYSGGDDLLFLAPVVNDKNNIFDLVQLLEEEFKTTVSDKYKPILEAYYKSKNEDADKRKYPSISYGVSVTFYKFPLYEAKNLSYSLLRKIKHESANKNEIEFTLMKHSGQVVSFTIPKMHNNSIDLFKAVRDFVKEQNSSTEFLNSFTYKLNQLRPMILDCLSDKTATHDDHREERLINFFKNNFNENFSSNKGFYKALSEFIIKEDDFKQMTLNDFNLIHGALRFIAFISKK